MAIKPKPAEQAALERLAAMDAKAPGGFWPLPETTRKIRDRLVTQGYVETRQTGALVAYRITDDGRRAARIRTPQFAAR